MGEYLNLFKKAGLEEILQPALIGAGAGGLGMGAASMLNNDDEKASVGDRLKSGLGSAAKGALLGGLAGAGYGGIKEIAANNFTPPPAVKDILDTSSQKLDSNPFGVSHPFLAQLGNVLHAPEWLSGAAGAASGMGLVRSMRSAGKNIADSSIAKITEKKPFAVDPLTSAEALQSARSRVGAGGAADKVMSSFTNLFKNTNTARKAAIEQITKNNFPGVGRLGTDPSQGPALHSPIPNAGALPMDQLKGTTKLLHADNFAKGNLAKQQSAARSILQGIENPISSSAKRYGTAGLAGAATAVGGHAAAKHLFDRYLNTYPEEQLRLWNELAKQ